MGCEEVRPRLAAFLDGESEERDAIQSHLDSCPECRGVLESHKKVCRLSGIVPDLEPSKDAWNRVETRLSSSSNQRFFAVLPVAAAACIAVVIYFFVSSTEEGSLGSLVEKLGPVSIKPLAETNWLEPRENQPVKNGDSIRTGAEGAAELQMGDRGHLVIDCNTELGFFRADEQGRLILEVRDGKVCVWIKKDVMIIAGRLEMESSLCEVVAVVENNEPAVYVKSGCLACRAEKESVELKSMSKAVLDENGEILYQVLESEEPFMWANKYFDPVGCGK